MDALLAFEKCAWFLSAEEMGPFQTGSVQGGGMPGWSIPRAEAAAAPGKHSWSVLHGGASWGAWQGWAWPDGSAQSNVLESCLSCTLLLAC